ncbi:MAG: phage holin family protein [Chloroflexi bacterium]|nr:MAG: phage holin family protein [Chloroflexota bacterium]TMB96283.1 MAG: phage holin family protein [Chloroflexota bacterium]TMC29174.1 MAG: phage holin family protein [Chloroflexota bacterium]TMC34725.1 MAG: phage holin family protein [Chloroflexota bacterium]TMC58670.1 MAG: phage holin family protein [Chloroflexota bacterium]
MGFLLRAGATAVAIWLVALIVPGITWGQGVSYGFGDLDKYIALVLTGLVLGLVNGFVRPILLLISMPLSCATLGLFVFIINAIMLILVTFIPQLGFHIDNFLSALVGSILISLVSGAISKVVH